MTPQEKAQELEQTYNDFTYQACIAMHEWTKQQMIDKATKWLYEQDYGGWIESETEELIDEFKKTMEE